MPLTESEKKQIHDDLEPDCGNVDPIYLLYLALYNTVSMNDPNYEEFNSEKREYVTVAAKFILEMCVKVFEKNNQQDNHTRKIKLLQSFTSLNFAEISNYKVEKILLAAGNMEYKRLEHMRKGIEESTSVEDQQKALEAADDIISTIAMHF
ncbi:MAG: hypothetical protein UT13_C0001G0614 [Candidatus Pacebacteria bacterium GW2011_GWF2_38_9]|nr:MAG: hypothetical protein US01_C0001G0633 [candidate division TM6 bacterium GW2011_GWF2_28_16]KKQ08702.1 MAG: hypothetical protein US20_C0013G0052 [Candidatus Pacebacteria bacterium GW2011_GWF1_36_5]KKQ88967.1 MAG: hypothetical protein UT13_C0001G0614 [Candidatus Pacebacteria bacterium GW2011_GWF2_38_9]HAZ73142.1 hypothetical protein [Candidatus Paceibacterota bacterium]